MPTKKALLVGINYEGQPHHALRGCWKDVERMGECLVSRYGFPKESICTLVDRPGTSPDLMPTGTVHIEDTMTSISWIDTVVENAATNDDVLGWMHTPRMLTCTFRRLATNLSRKPPRSQRLNIRILGKVW